ncbi:hypothetical protein PND85_00330 [[Eubacterium] siraeum]|nr:hypothetical protein [[Eubacterium] siraeum]
MYYLNSRYYDPQTGRFINADVCSAQTGLLLIIIFLRIVEITRLS